MSCGPTRQASLDGLHHRASQGRYRPRRGLPRILLDSGHALELTAVFVGKQARMAANVRLGDELNVVNCAGTQRVTQTTTVCKTGGLRPLRAAGASSSMASWRRRTRATATIWQHSMGQRLPLRRPSRRSPSHRSHPFTRC